LHPTFSSNTFDLDIIRYWGRRIPWFYFRGIFVPFCGSVWCIRVLDIEKNYIVTFLFKNRVLRRSGLSNLNILSHPRSQLLSSTASSFSSTRLSLSNTLVIITFSHHASVTRFVCPASGTLRLG
jgi:hypothetical protein